MSDDRVAIICSPFTSLRLPTVAGSTVARCQECRGPVWLSPSSAEYIGAHPLGTEIWCAPCALAAMPADAEMAPDFIPGSLAELAAAGVDAEEARRVREAMRREARQALRRRSR